MTPETQMNHYIHEIPGRLRIQSAALRCQSAKASQAQALVLATAGVNSVRVNPRAGSLTVEYDPGRLDRGKLLAVLEEVGYRPTRGAGGPRDARSAGAASALFGKALAGALVNKLAERSALELVSVLL